MIYYRSLDRYLRERFGTKVYKLALDGNFTCPNRDGTKGTDGCIFCLEGSGGFAVKCDTDLNGAVETAKYAVQSKGPVKYIAYFQSHTNTYGPVEKLERLFLGAAEREDIVAVSVATRPDCLGDDVVELLREINSIKPVFVELGLQTVHEQTSRYIRRGYELDVYDDAMKKLRDSELETVVHMIIGLPGETEKMMVQTADYIRESGADGIKFQLLHVLEGTDLADDYRKGKFEVLTLEQYVDILKKCVTAAGENIIVHRLTGDGAKRDLVAPLWSADKKRVINTIRREILPLE